MVSSIVKWFVKGDSLTQEVRNALKDTDISKLSKDDIEEKAKKIFNNRSTWFVDAKTRAIKSTLKEIVREQKTVAIARLLYACNNSTTILSLRKVPASIEKIPSLDNNQMAPIVEEAKKIAKSLGSDKVLSEDEITVIMKNESIIRNLFNKHQVMIYNNGICTSINADKAVNKKIESKFPYIIPDDKQHQYKEYYTEGLDLDEVRHQEIEEMRTILVNDIKRNLLNKFTDTEKGTFMKAASKGFSTFNYLSPTSVRRLAGEIAFNVMKKEPEAVFNQEEQFVLDKLADSIENGQGKLFNLKAKTLQVAAGDNKKILANFTDTEIQLLNQIFGTQIKK